MNSFSLQIREHLVNKLGVEFIKVEEYCYNTFDFDCLLFIYKGIIHQIIYNHKTNETKAFVKNHIIFACDHLEVFNNIDSDIKIITSFEDI